MSRSADKSLLSNFGFVDPDRHNRFHDNCIRYLAETCETVVQTCEPHLFDVQKYYREENGILNEHCNWTKTLTATKIEMDVTKVQFQSDVILTKGENQYKQTVGFLDGILQFILSVTYNVRTTERCRKPNTSLTLSDALQMAQIRDPFCDRKSIIPLKKPYVLANELDKTMQSLGLHRVRDGHLIIRMSVYELSETNAVETRLIGYTRYIETKIGIVSLGSVCNQIELYRAHLEKQSENTVPIFYLPCAFEWAVIEQDALLRKQIYPFVLGPHFEIWCTNNGLLERKKPTFSLTDVNRSTTAVKKPRTKKPAKSKQVSTAMPFSVNMSAIISAAQSPPPIIQSAATGAHPPPPPSYTTENTFF